MSAALLLACPLCAQRPQSTASAALVLAFLVLPFLLAAVTFLVVRRFDH